MWAQIEVVSIRYWMVFEGIRGFLAGMRGVIVLYRSANSIPAWITLTTSTRQR